MRFPRTVGVLAAFVVVPLLVSCAGADRSDDAAGPDEDDPIELGVSVDDPTQTNEIVLFDDGERSVVLVEPVTTGDGRTWSVEWDSGDESRTQPAVFTESIARCAAIELTASTEPFLAELRARGLDTGAGTDGAERSAVIDALLVCDGQDELLALAIASLPDFDPECLTELLATDQDIVDLYGLQNPDATMDERRPAAERFGPCLDLTSNAPEDFRADSIECVRAAEVELGTEMMLGDREFVQHLVAVFEDCLTPEELAQLNLG